MVAGKHSANKKRGLSTEVLRKANQAEQKKEERNKKGLSHLRKWEEI